MVKQRNRSQSGSHEATPLGDFIREHREAMGFSIRGLSAASGVHYSFIARLESGENRSASPEVLQKLANVLEVDAKDLFALAGLTMPEGLPAFTPYLRAKYRLPKEALSQLGEYFAFVSEKYGVRVDDNDLPGPRHSPNGQDRSGGKPKKSKRGTP
ncbi:MAG: helix-turn-helix domain-containing protein [Actinomycetota bacterium]